MAEPRVLLLDPDCFTPYYDLGLGQALARQGWAVEWITSRYHYGHLAPPHLVRTEELFFSRLNRNEKLRRFLAERPLPRRACKALFYPLDMAAFSRYLAAREPGVLHAQWFLAPWLDARLARAWRNQGWKVVYTVHDPRPLSGTGLGRAVGGAAALYRACRVLVVHDEWARRELIRAGAPSDLVRVLPPGPPDLAEPAPISQNEARERLGLPARGPVALFFGLIKPYKGLEVLLEAWPQVERRLGPAHLLVGGAFASTGLQCQRRAAGLGLDPERVRFSGRYLSPQEKDLYFAAADCVALPYVQASSSGVLLSAYLRAKPVVVSRVGGLPEMVEDGVSGLLVPPQDPDAMAHALVELLGDPGRARDMGRAGRSLLDRRYAWPGVAHLTAELYRSL